MNGFVLVNATLILDKFGFMRNYDLRGDVAIRIRTNIERNVHHKEALHFIQNRDGSRA